MRSGNYKYTYRRLDVKMLISPSISGAVCLIHGGMISEIVEIVDLVDVKPNAYSNSK